MAESQRDEIAQLLKSPIRVEHIPDLKIASSALCKLFGIPAKTLSEYVHGEVIRPPYARGKWLMKDFAEDYIGHLKSQLSGRMRGPNAKIGENPAGYTRKGIDLEAKGRIDTAKAEIVELELAEKRGDVAPIQDHADWMTAICAEIRSRLLQLPSRAAAEAFDAPSVQVCEQRIAEVVHETLEVLADGAAARRRQLEELAATHGNAWGVGFGEGVAEGDGGRAPTASPFDRERVGGQAQAPDGGQLG